MHSSISYRHLLFLRLQKHPDVHAGASHFQTNHPQSNISNPKLHLKLEIPTLLGSRADAARGNGVVVDTRSSNVAVDTRSTNVQKHTRSHLTAESAVVVLPQPRDIKDIGVVAQSDDISVTVASKTDTKIKSTTVDDETHGTNQRKNKSFSKLKVTLYRMACEKIGVKQLPPGWNMRISRTRGEVLYYCTRTGERRWTPPPQFHNMDPTSPISMWESKRTLQSELLCESKHTLSSEQSPKGHPMSPTGHPMSPGIRTLYSNGSAHSNFTQAMIGADEISLFGGGSVRSPVLEGLIGAEDDVSEFVQTKSPDGDDMVIPPWPDDLKSTINTLARILIGCRQIVCTRAEFGLQVSAFSLSLSCTRSHSTFLCSFPPLPIFIFVTGCFHSIHLHTPTTYTKHTTTLSHKHIGGRSTCKHGSTGESGALSALAG